MYSSVPSKLCSWAIHPRQVSASKEAKLTARLLPTKFMASQLAIELTLENPDACIFVQTVSGSGANPTYGVGNINLIPEILEFDASYGM